MVAYTFLISTALFYYFGRSIWHPVYLHVRGKQTTVDIYKEIGSNVENDLKPVFSKAGVSYPPSRLTIIALKDERKLELWANNSNGVTTFIDSYKFKGFSGKLGPKLREGDYQIPEGIYKIEYLNPNSSYHLSMKVSYPNNYDKKKAELDGRSNLGGDIFIHGKSTTVGCIPVGDSNIEKLFILVYRVGKDNVDVIISPYDMRIKGMTIQYNNLSWLPEKHNNIKNVLINYKKS